MGSIANIFVTIFVTLLSCVNRKHFRYYFRNAPFWRQSQTLNSLKHSRLLTLCRLTCAGDFIERSHGTPTPLGTLPNSLKHSRPLSLCRLTCAGACIRHLHCTPTLFKHPPQFPYALSTPQSVQGNLSKCFYTHSALYIHSLRHSPQFP